MCFQVGAPCGPDPPAGDDNARMTAPTDARPLSEAELEALQALLDGLPPTLDPLDVVSIDGYLCGVLLQPRPVPEAQWLRHVPDVDGRPPPARFDQAMLATLLRRRHAELERAIAQRQWFDPWVYQLDDEASPSETVMPWVAGFATALDLFPVLQEKFEAELLEPMATLYRHLDPDDLEDADALLAEIETLAPPESLAEAVEDLVRSVLLMADVARPRAEAPRTAGPGGRAPLRRAGPASPSSGAARTAARPANRPQSGPPSGPPTRPPARQASGAAPARKTGKPPRGR
mgnify:CR=1 FL=1